MPGPDDLLALADAVREAANAEPDDAGAARREVRGSLEPPVHAQGGANTGRRGHLRILRD